MRLAPAPQLALVGRSMVHPGTVASEPEQKQTRCIQLRCDSGLWHCIVLGAFYSGRSVITSFVNPIRARYSWREGGVGPPR